MCIRTQMACGQFYFCEAYVPRQSIQDGLR